MTSPIPTSTLTSLQSLIPTLKITTPSSPAYEKSIERWFTLSIKRAAAVVYPLTPTETATIIQFCTAHSIALAVRGGGHGLRAESSIEGGLVIDLSEMKGVVVEGTKVIAKGGVLWNEVYAEVEKFELAAVGGVCPDVGIGGFLLHGGYGFLSGARGLGLDSVLEMEVVLADGSIVRASEVENQDLFWAMRGAGGCFGVVTEFVLQAYEQNNEVWTGRLMFPRSALKVVTEMGNRVAAGGNGGKAVMGQFWKYSAEGMMLLVVPFYNGSEDEARAFYAPLLELNPVVNHVKMVPYSQSGETATPPGKWRKLSAARSVISPMSYEFLEERLSDFEKFLERVPDAREESVVGFEIYPTSALVSVKQHETAFSDRGNHTTARILPIYSNEENDAVCKEWALEMDQKFAELFEQRKLDPDMDEVTKLSTGVYLNYDGFGAHPKLIFGDNLERLVELKKRYDPQNVFKTCIDLL